MCCLEPLVEIVSLKGYDERGYVNGVYLFVDRDRNNGVYLLDDGNEQYRIYSYAIGLVVILWSPYNVLPS